MSVTSTLQRRVIGPLAMTSLLLAGACAGGSDNAGSPSASASDTASTGTSSGATAPSSPVSSAPSTPPGSTSAAPSADVKVIAVRYRNGKVTPSPDRISVSKGQNVRIEVTSDATDEIHVHGYDLTAGLAPNRTAVVSFRANQTGLYEVEVEDAGVLLFQLLVR